MNYIVGQLTLSFHSSDDYKDSHFQSKLDTYNRNTLYKELHCAYFTSVLAIDNSNLIKTKNKKSFLSILQVKYNHIFLFIYSFTNTYHHEKNETI